MNENVPIEKFNKMFNARGPDSVAANKHQVEIMVNYVTTKCILCFFAFAKMFNMCSSVCDSESFTISFSVFITLLLLRSIDRRNN